jgi:2-polyprenyl-3-methyl-5-hydroxy-6-metoxy-1,4-benzoquinol methylase
MIKSLLNIKRMNLDDAVGRFAFGENWARFLTILDDNRIREAESSLCTMLGVKSLAGKSFLDIGSGSGLFSLAARRLGAQVHSFDYDPQSVACTAELHRRFFPGDIYWKVEQGSALDTDYLQSLGTFDIVYSWGVLHHTGAMWLGIENAIRRVAGGGQLFIAIYNDQGAWSRIWWLIKWLQKKIPASLHTFYAFSVWYSIIGLNLVKHTLLFHPMRAIRPLLAYRARRGMSVNHDILDWIGGMPYEFCSFSALVNYFDARGFQLQKSSVATGHGCHEMVFQKIVPGDR